MDSFTVHTGVAAPLRRSDVDTDQIFPGRFGASYSRTGYAHTLFADWRADPRFVLNKDAYRDATILVAGENFGTGSSREHAVWALQDFGFRVVISPRFGDIFRANALMAGLLAVTLQMPVVEELWRMVEKDPGQRVTVDLVTMRVTAGRIAQSFECGADTRIRLMNGLDPIDATLRYANMITDYESRRRPDLPTSAPLAGLG